MSDKPKTTAKPETQNTATAQKPAFSDESLIILKRCSPTLAASRRPILNIHPSYIKALEADGITVVKVKDVKHEYRSPEEGPVPTGKPQNVKECIAIRVTPEMVAVWESMVPAAYAESKKKRAQEVQEARESSVAEEKPTSRQ